jgi:hypothetical protein
MFPTEDSEITECFLLGFPVSSVVEGMSYPANAFARNREMCQASMYL